MLNGLFNKIRDVRPARKKFLLIALIGGAVIIVFAYFFFMRKTPEVSIEDAGEAVSQEQPVEIEEGVMDVSEELLSPEEILEREEGIAGGPLEITPSLVIDGEAPSEEIPTERITKGDVMVADREKLKLILKDILSEGRTSVIYLALQKMESKGLKPISALRREILNHPDDPDIRKSAILGLFLIGDYEVVPLLKTAVKVDPDEEVRLFSLFCLDFLAAKGEEEFFKEVAESDPSEKVRDKAREYLRVKNRYQ